jgi:hypothetical protein
VQNSVAIVRFCVIITPLKQTTEENNKMNIIAKIRNNTFKAKKEGGKFYAWVPRANAWQRVAKTKIFKA